MRLWSIHPKYLDSKGLIAIWREGLLAKKVLAGRTTAYRNHPQLERFRGRDLIDAYLFSILEESRKRGYCFSGKKIRKIRLNRKIPIRKGQVFYEFQHLKKKLRIRDKHKFKEIERIKIPITNPVFFIREGGIEKWEKY